jgi:hypothetical protein
LRRLYAGYVPATVVSEVSVDYSERPELEAPDDAPLDNDRSG